MSEFLKSIATATTIIHEEGTSDVSIRSINEEVAKLANATGIQNISKAFQLYVSNKGSDIETGTQVTETLVALCQSIQGIGMTRESKEIAVGGQSDTQFFVTGRVKYKDITIKNVISDNPAFLKWVMNDSDVSGGRLQRLNLTVKVGVGLKKSENSSSSTSTTGDAKPLKNPIYSFTMENAFPVEWELAELKIAPDGKNSFFETIKFKYSRLTLTDAQ